MIKINTIDKKLSNGFRIRGFKLEDFGGNNIDKSKLNIIINNLKEILPQKGETDIQKGRRQIRILNFQEEK